MSRKCIYSFLAIIGVLCIVWILNSNSTANKREERIKIVLREVGNQLLLANKDSTSLVLPVVVIDDNKFELSFQNTLSFEPSNLVSIIKQNLEKGEIKAEYIVEVIQCNDKEVAYSYGIKKTEEKSIIPCRGRVLPKNCYTIEIQFTQIPPSNINSILFLSVLVFIIIAILLLEFVYFKQKQDSINQTISSNSISIGKFQFYPEENKLINNGLETSLSKRECELLVIFVAHKNQIVSREELTKKVWGDHSVVVGRSLDTYISKLRKKIVDDDAIKLTNVHGVGYKLESTK